MFSNTTSIPSPNSSSTDWTANRPWTTFEFAIATVIAVLSPVAVAGNGLILAATWKKTFSRTPFHILLSGLAFTDLSTGLIAQPFYAGSTLMKVANHRVEYFIFSTIGDSSAIYFILITVLFIAVMSIERWLHMSQRSLVTSRRGCFTVILLSLIPSLLRRGLLSLFFVRWETGRGEKKARGAWGEGKRKRAGNAGKGKVLLGSLCGGERLIPIPSVVYRVLADEDNENEVYARIVFRMIITLMISSYHATSFAYFKSLSNDSSSPASYPSKRNISEFWSTSNRPGKVQKICGFHFVYFSVVFFLFRSFYCM